MRVQLLKTIFLSIIVTASLSAQKNDRKAYILKYAQVAVDEMHRTGVPASITLAQGILESGNGKSDLAARSNNHFGIKCHSSWTGAKVYHDDDEKGECFRKYKKVEHSFEDHSDFLVRGARYVFLFELEPGDYKGWAKGLKNAGYATAPEYADRLIAIIEQEALYSYDRIGGARYAAVPQDSLVGGAGIGGPVLNGRGKPVKSAKKRFIIRRVANLPHTSAFVVLMEGEEIERIADSLHMRLGVLLDINDAGWESKFRAGERIYVDYKKLRGRSKTVLVRPGQTMRDISQQECVRLERLYKYNEMKVGQQPAANAVLRLRPRGIFEKR